MKVSAEDFESQCAAGNAKACFMAAEPYLQKTSDSAAKEKGLTLLKRSSSLGAAPAYNQIGLLNLQGDVLKQDLPLAHKCFYKAAAKGYFMSFFNLAQMYGNGIGVTQDAKIAKMWLLLASASAPEQLLSSEAFIKLNNAVSAKISDEDIRAAKADAENFKSGIYLASPSKQMEPFLGDPGF
jgi:TPR repeat protein